MINGFTPMFWRKFSPTIKPWEIVSWKGNIYSGVEKYKYNCHSHLKDKIIFLINGKTPETILDLQPISTLLVHLF